MPLIVAAQTEAKLPGQSENQDSVHAHVTNVGPTACGLFMVADGVGGHKDGRLASQTAVNTIHAAIQPLWEQTPTTPTQAAQFLQSHLYNAIVAANEKIYTQAKEQNVRMASTLTCALVYDTLAIIANIGDSRTYLYRNQQLEQITVDHSVVDWLVRQGHLAPEDAATHPYRNVIMHALGSHETPEVDIFLRWLQPDDMLVLCCDGVWDTLSNEQIAAQLENSNPETAVPILLAAAQDHSDDISLVIVQVTA
ncbi:MAG TPA: protein phosphatase 2C domain-containing protein [Chloroflexota bacterium]|nr:protein phosphatase 2C domain-containing protein [Chloroflexota bacterium]